MCHSVVAGVQIQRCQPFSLPRAGDPLGRERSFTWRGFPEASHI